MDYAKKLVIEALARQYAWYIRRFGRGEKAKDNVEMATGFVVVMPAMLVVMVLLAPLLLSLQLKYVYIVGPILLIALSFLVQRFADRIFKDEYDTILAAAVVIFEDPARGPGWALRRQLLVGIGALLLFGAAAVALRAVAVKFDLVANPAQFQGLADLSEYHRSNKTDLDRFADRFEQDENFSQVVCGSFTMQYREVGSDFLEPMTSEYHELYSPLCQFSRNISVQRTSRGVRFPKSFYEQGELFFQVNLDRRRNAFDFDQECNSEALAESSGRCDVPLDSRWAVSYSWDPFCVDGLRADVGCE